MNLYPLKFKPIYKERLWGGVKLKSVLEKEINGNAIGESWELSAVEGSVSQVVNGELAGTLLSKLMTTYKEQLLGRHVYEKFGNDFPVLIKFIDANKDLSIQLHPNDKLAKERHNCFGKTEMWYIMQADENAELIVGFNKEVSKDEYEQHMKKDTLEEILNYEKVKEGDTFFINTGKIHAIGAGILLAEIQQTSDITYRVYDWNRKDKDGNTRELHTELALEAIDYEKKDDFIVAYSQDKNTVNKMVDCPYFTTNYLNIDTNTSFDISKRDSFSIYLCVSGAAEIVNEYGAETIKKGETLLIPAKTEKIVINPFSKAKLLEVYI